MPGKTLPATCSNNAAHFTGSAERLLKQTAFVQDLTVLLQFCLASSKHCKWEETRSPVVLLYPWMTVMEHLHDVFGALHEEDMQRQVPVCMLLNECFSFSLLPCHVLSEDNNVEGGCFLPYFSSPLCFLFLSIHRVHLEYRR